MMNEGKIPNEVRDALMKRDRDRADQAFTDWLARQPEHTRSLMWPDLGSSSVMAEQLAGLTAALAKADDYIFCECVLNVNVPDLICEGHTIVRDALLTVGVHIPPIESEDA